MGASGFWDSQEQAKKTVAKLKPLKAQVENLLAAHSESLEAALWAALRALDESASLTRRMAARARDHQHESAAQRYL